MISVCIATYNGERYIRQQIESILPQLSPDDEIIISDDASTDETIGVVQEIQSPLIHIYINNGEHGYIANFENALRYAKGDYIFLSDQDDLWHDNKVALCMEALASVDLVVSDADIVNAEGQQILPSFYSERRPMRTFLGNIVKFGYLGCCLAFRRSVRDKALPFPRRRKLCTHDNWLFLVALFFFKVKILDDKLIDYRRHDGNASTGALNARKTWRHRIIYRFYIVCMLLYRAIYSRKSA